jgi:haloalkane dehalogenase
VTETFRTPDERFDGLPGYPWEPRYREWEGLRLAYLDEGGEGSSGDGAGETIVLLHGEPTWSYLWRKVMPPLLDAGHRCIAPDLPGFGRSDKPTEMDWYSYDGHTDAIASLLEELDLRDVTLVVHDWGGPIGLRVAAESPERISRLVVMDTGIFTGEQKMSDAWKAFRDFVARTEDLPIGMLIQGACATDVPDEVIAAYEAPFPSPDSKAGARAFPLLLATTPDAPGAEAGRNALAALQASSPPALVLWADSDPILTPEMGARLAEKLGWPAPEPIPNASHFLQEDQGEMIGRRIAGWLADSA